MQEKLWKSVEKGFSEIPVSAELKATALDNLRYWLDDSRFAEAYPQLEGLIRSGKFASLFDAFFRQIPFGTGGRRGPVGFGTNR
ncbi:MAG: phospho-sugar mutase, partial [Acidobacteriota bacterium]